MKNPGRIRVGAVPYANALPLVADLEDDPAVELIRAVPSRLAALLDRGEVDCALVSSAHVLRRDLPFAEGIGIASEGPVWSVLLVGLRDPARARTVALDGASLTAAALARIFYRGFLERTDVRFVPAPPAPDPACTGADATLVIGDRALRPDIDRCWRIDLGEVWTRRTGLPFVWALWALSPRLPADRRAALSARLATARDRGLSRIDRLVGRTAAPPLDPNRLHEYLARVVHYSLGPEEREALSLFDRYLLRLAPPASEVRAD